MKNRTTIYVLAALCFLTTQIFAAQEKYLDCYEEAARLFGVAGAGHHIDVDLDKRLKAPYYFIAGHKSYKTPGFAYDYEDKVNGDFSVTYKPVISKHAPKFGFMMNLWGHYPTLDDRFALKFSLKTQNVTADQAQWQVTLVDDQERTATSILRKANTGGQWQAYEFSLASFEKTSDFNINAITLCEFESPKFSDDAVIKFDFIRYDNHQGNVIGITDKTITQRIAEQKATKATRITKAFEASAKKAHQPIISAFAKLYLNQDLAEANEIIRTDCKEMLDEDPWSLLTTPIYCRIYLLFSNRLGEFPGRLEAQTEKTLLETIWHRTKHKNDIHWARQSTWYLDGSENHDLNAKASNLVSSYIFMNEPDYKDRIYPDYGFGGGYHYGHAGYYGQDINASTREGGGRANLKDGKSYTAKDHYNEWLAFMKTYFRERAKHGFFVENSSQIYSKHTMNMIDLAYAYSGDEELHGIIDDFLTLYWADWLQTGIAGISGGPKTRHHKSVGSYGANKGMVGFFLGGPADGGIWGFWNNINGYEMPKVVQMMALDREGMGNFVYQARGIGEAEENQPRPMGAERTLIVKPESKFRKYSYVTPLYTLSTQMDHPWAVHSHLSKAGRWHGMTVTSDVEARVVPVFLPAEPDFRGSKKPISMEDMYKTLQHENSLIVQRSRSFSEVNPDWYPLYKQRVDQGVHIGTSWDQQIEQGGWVFLREGDVYAGVRVVLWDEAFEKEKAKKLTTGTQQVFHGPDDEATVKLADKPYTFSEDGKMIVCKERYSPIIIQSGDQATYGSFESFMQQVQSAPIALYKTVVPTFNILAYTPPGVKQPELVFNGGNNEIPMVDGKYISYEHPKTFDSPFMTSQFKSGKIKLAYDGEELDLDFSGQAVSADQAAFDQATKGNWQTVLTDSCTVDWTKQWFLDGEVASVETSPLGMQLTAGPQFANDAHHMVLWTKDEFAGDVKIEYDYTRLDDETRCVTILYIQATGSGEAPYISDITQWNDLRRVPAMRMYFDHMNTYHISYAAFPNVGDDRTSYIRARRYMPNQTGLKGSDLKPDYFPEGLFAPGVKHHITVIKRDRDIYMQIDNGNQIVYCHMSNPDLPIVKAGRIGLRHMFTRSARYKNFSISQLKQ